MMHPSCALETSRRISARTRGILRIGHPTARLRLSGGKSRCTVYERCVGAMSYRVARPK